MWALSTKEKALVGALSVIVNFQSEGSSPALVLGCLLQLAAGAKWCSSQDVEAGLRRWVARQMEGCKGGAGCAVTEYYYTSLTRLQARSCDTANNTCRYLSL